MISPHYQYTISNGRGPQGEGTHKLIRFNVLPLDLCARSLEENRGKGYSPYPSIVFPIRVVKLETIAR